MNKKELKKQNVRLKDKVLYLEAEVEEYKHNYLECLKDYKKLEALYDELREMTRWKSIDAEKPMVVTHPGGSCNAVLACYTYKETPVSGSQFQVSSASYVVAHPEKFRYWVDIQELP